MDRENGTCLDGEEYASGVCEKFKPSDAARALLKDQMSASAFLNALRDAGLWGDAIAFLAHGLGRRQAVWWASQCVRASLGPTLDERNEAAVSAAERWAVEPTEECRRAAEKIAEELKYETPAAIAAIAAFFSSGSVSLPDAPLVPPPPHLTGDMAKTAVLTAAALSADNVAASKKSVDLGMGLEKSAERWAEVAQAVADEHAGKGRDDESRRLKEAALEEAGKSPAETKDKRMAEEIERALGPKKAAEEEQKKRIEELRKRHEEAEAGAGKHSA